ncbi:MAG TPA: hypothetical protein PLM53_16510 [Spirochaetota bacterium]|nr:hypothetical protein [Spirochaetota bacterium]HPC42289.1 hypothetical protein [Spirochaetota bacterium]HPL16639.1 hypothetical protein [Spirochaetota bacterium]HQF09995.1 hypothetical protein [Spirochaetota bacterium]HQH98699.1 hypothetical protein [Spirochaetota bacterium]
MIKLKNGHVVTYQKDFDAFFQDLLESMVRESRRSAAGQGKQTEDQTGNELFLKELMDNCIYVTHQLFDLAREKEEFSRFMVTGFIFNSIICSLPVLENEMPPESGPEDEGPVH